MELSSYFGRRVERIRSINPVKCPVIYIGASGYGVGTLRSGFKDLAGLRHTIFYPVFILLSASANSILKFLKCLPNKAFEFSYLF